MEKYPARLDHLFEHLQFILNHNSPLRGSFLEDFMTQALKGSK